MANANTAVATEAGQYACTARVSGQAYTMCYGSVDVAITDALDSLGQYISVVKIDDDPMLHTHDRKGDCLRTIAQRKTPLHRRIMDAKQVALNFKGARNHMR